jgi:hypothetical protein
VTEIESNKKTGRIIAIVFLAIMILPACYALIKELRYKQTDKDKIKTQAPMAPASK